MLRKGYFFLLFSFFLSLHPLFATNAPDIQYIVFLRADGPLGADLDKYWTAVRGSDLDHEAISQYPPHCTITGFFHPTHDANYYLNAIQQAVVNIGGSPSVAVSPTIQHAKTLDYLVLTSNYVKDFGNEFVELVNLPSTLVKGPPGFTFHITLRDKTFKRTLNRLQRIQNLQSELIDPSNAAGWLIYLYIKENDVLSPFGQPVRIIPVP